MKKLLLLPLFLFITNIYAETKPIYKGINQLAMSESFATQLLENSINNYDEIMMDKWDKEKGFKFPYKNVEPNFLKQTREQKKANNFNSYNQKNETEVIVDACSIDFRFLLLSEKKLKIMDKKDWNSSLINGNGSYIFFSSCKELPLMKLNQKTRENEVDYHEEIKEVYPNYKKEILPEQYKKNDFIYKYMLKSIEQLDDNQWDQLIFLIINNSLPYHIRDIALDKLIELYPKREKNYTNIQKEYWDKNFNSYILDNNNYLLKINLYNFLFNNLFLKLKDSTYILTNPELTKEKNTFTLFTKDYFLGKSEITEEEIFKYYSKYPKIEPSVVKNFRNFYFNYKLLNKIRKLKDFDLNTQDTNGNTFMHIYFNFKNSHISYGADNLIIANLIRAFLEEGANPMLLNKENKTPFMLFEETKTQRHHKFPFLTEAFILEEYNK